MLKDLKQNLRDGKMLKQVQHDSHPIPTFPSQGRSSIYDLRLTNLAFTLAEVLIVIGIIGVVAALTLPNLNHATGDKEKVTKVKKIYSALTEAVDRAQAIYGPFDTWFKDLSTDAEKNERFAKRVTEFMKVSKDCGFDGGCFADKPLLDSHGYVLLSGSYLENLQGFSSYMVSLSDGTTLAFQRNYYNMIRVDIDGPNKGKNQYGSDIFDFSIYTYEIQNIDLSADINENQLYPSAQPYLWTGNLNNEASYGNYSTAWVIENGNLDYLKTDDEGNCPDGQSLNWETKTSCE